METSSTEGKKANNRNSKNGPFVGEYFHFVGYYFPSKWKYSRQSENILVKVKIFSSKWKYSLWEKINNRNSFKLQFR